MKYIFFIFFIFAAFSTSAQISKTKSDTELMPQTMKLKTSEAYSYLIVPSINKSWGYCIYKENKQFIHQSSIPGVSGNEGFKLKSDAEKVAQLVIEKLKSGEIPPSVTKQELIKLNVLR